MPADTLPELGPAAGTQAPSAKAFRAPGAPLADKAAVGLLLAALSTLWLFERSPYIYSMGEGGYRSAMTAQRRAAPRTRRRISPSISNPSTSMICRRIADSSALTT